MSASTIVWSSKYIGNVTANAPLISIRSLLTHTAPFSAAFFTQ